MLYPTERIDYLLSHDLKIIQSDEVFNFSIDAVLLSMFVSLPLRRGRIMDLCSGNGVIPLLLSTRTKAMIEGIEIQERLHGMACRSVALNGLGEQITIHRGDIREAHRYFPNNAYDVVTCNPPYLPVGGGEKNENLHQAIARHEIYCTLEDAVKASARLVKPGGKVAFVHRASRAADVIETMRKYRIEPKRIRFVHPRAHEPANIILCEGIRDGGVEVKILPPLFVYDQGGNYTEEIQRIYDGESRL
ncbi:tRNA1(Val) (adenine(37)-N6)-methyltransferase [Bacillaceae bacterium]